jgi:putative membrane protein
MGCIGKFVFTVIALFGFSLLGWISLVPGTSFFLAAFWTVLIVLLVDLLLLLVKALIHVLALPFTVLTAGFLALIIEAVFKYIGLWVASSWTGMFTLPWIFGAFWWQALLIGFVFVIIGIITTPTSSSD